MPSGRRGLGLESEKRQDAMEARSPIAEGYLPADSVLLKFCVARHNQNLYKSLPLVCSLFCQWGEPP